MKFITTFFVIFVLFILMSCDTIMFEAPQPVGIKNSYAFPNKFIGIWRDTINSGEIIVNKTTCIWDIKEQEKFILTKVLDTATNFLIKNDKLYQINTNMDTYLSQGFKFRIQNDTLFYVEKSSKELALSQLNFFRKCNQYYILNMKGENNWYLLLLVYLNENNHLIIRGMSRNEIELLNQRNILYQKEQGETYQLFSNQQWTKIEMLKYIQRGFKDTLMYLHQKKRTKNHTYPS